MVYLKIFACISLVGSIAWMIIIPGFEPALAMVGAISAILALFFTGRRERNNKNQQKQKVSINSSGIQAGGDITVNNNGKGNE
jgi:hypothetical protein